MSTACFELDFAVLSDAHSTLHLHHRKSFHAATCLRRHEKRFSEDGLLAWQGGLWWIPQLYAWLSAAILIWLEPKLGRALRDF